jgi:hypothetical protein
LELTILNNGESIADLIRSGIPEPSDYNYKEIPDNVRMLQNWIDDIDIDPSGIMNEKLPNIPVLHFGNVPRDYHMSPLIKIPKHFRPNFSKYHSTFFSNFKFLP